MAEPPPGYSHFSAPIDNKLYLWGGYNRKDTSIVSHFDPDAEVWGNDTCEGPHPPGISDGATASAGHHLYTYGGYNGAHDVQGTLHQLDIESWIWKLVTSGRGPMMKAGCGMITYGSKILLFGGYGTPSAPTQPGAKFIKDPTNSKGLGWTNEVHIFDLQEGEDTLCYNLCTHDIVRIPSSTLLFMQVCGHHLVSLGKGPLQVAIFP